ncbi:class I SAM-dependent methyltransferase [Nonomuraea turcica]|uniref:class I SAM-dependent methyltransferase n=1 Tax=Nonomuraea sp. G32 TaxID=3067274 RepID=UPI00273B9A6E|nr:class I SAM-dependent methyltransferase [Nonomuraea sp. G32]MDP4502805.1 class I SAM-dependent methyltransferase [Nonomuraea sp. G32]
MPITTDDELENSPVVANSLMNRERRLRSYDRELGIDIVNVLGAAPTRPARWLDLCCGTANALSEAAALLGDDVEIVGVDLVGFFACPPNPPRLHLVTASVAAWRPGTRFDLITCVHGLHYVGDKLGLLARIGDWLTDDGLFVANFDTRGIRLRDGAPAGRRLTADLRAAGLAYDGRTRRIRRTGRASITLPYRYLGADDQAGPNYTGQPAVHSHYARA